MSSRIPWTPRDVVLFAGRARGRLAESREINPAYTKPMEAALTYESRVLAGVLLIVLPTVMIGGVSILSLLIGDPTYRENPLRQDLWRAGHAHAGVWLILALVALRYVDEANLSNAMKWLVRGCHGPNGGHLARLCRRSLLAVGVLVLGVGLVRRPAQ
jgi:hypothetical protein